MNYLLSFKNSASTKLYLWSCQKDNKDIYLVVNNIYLVVNKSSLLLFLVIVRFLKYHNGNVGFQVQRCWMGKFLDYTICGWHN